MFFARNSKGLTSGLFIRSKTIQVLDYPSNFQKYWPFQNLDNLFSCSKSLVIRSRAKRHTCKNRKIRLIGWTMTFCTFWGPWYAIVELFWRLFVEDKFKRSKDPSFWKMFFCNLPAITNLLLYEINIDNFFLKNGQILNIYEDFW